MVSTFRINQLEFTLTQTVTDAVNSGVQTGSVLTQNYAIQNLTDAANSFSLFRYLDGDLYLNDDTLDDGGGVMRQGGQLVLFETDISGSDDDDNTFIGITASGGTQPQTGAYSITPYTGYPNFVLDDSVYGDNDDDGFTDGVYDVTLLLRRDFLIPAGQSQIFTTTTLFGNATPPAPGSAESLPLLPSSTEVGETPVYHFDLPAGYQPEQVIWIDPVIAVGYTYEVTDGTFFSVTAPSMSAVPDTDGYLISVGGITSTLLAGQTYAFASGVTLFTLSGIDEALGLNPNNPLAFPTGIALANMAVGSTDITMTPITADTTPSAIPLPATGLLLVGGFGLLGGLRRRRRAS